MKKNLNNKGFTLIEVLAVIVLLAIIMAIALPNITGSLDRQSCKMVESRAKLIESAAQFYVSDHRNTIKNKLDGNKKCNVSTDILKENNKYITAADLEDGNNGTIEGYVVYNQSEESYTFCFNNDSCNYNKSICGSTSNNCH